jgi:hypothetical protein
MHKNYRLFVQLGRLLAVQSVPNLAYEPVGGCAQLQDIIVIHEFLSL